MSSDVVYSLESPYREETSVNTDKKSQKETLLTKIENKISAEEDQSQYLSAYEESFGKADKSFLLSGILNLASTHLGPGLLTLPYITRLCGVFGGSLFVFSGALINVLSKRMLSYSADLTQISDYRQLVAHVISPRWVVWFDICRIVFNLGLLCVYHSLGSQLFQSIILGAGETFSEGWIALLQILGFATLALPLCLLKTIHPLRFASILRVFVFALILSILAIGASKYGSYNWAIKKPAWHKGYNWGVFKTIGTVMFAFSCQLTLFPARPNVIKLDSPEKTRKIITYSYLGIAFYSYILAMLGYITLVDNTEPIVISRKPIPGSTYDSMLWARIGILLVIYFSIPMSVFQCRTSLHSAIKKDLSSSEVEEQSPAERILTSIVILYVTAAIGFAITSLDNFIACLGGFICGWLLLFFPMYIYDKLRTQDQSKKKAGWCRMFIIRWMYTKFTIIGVISGIMVILQISGVIDCTRGYNC